MRRYTSRPSLVVHAPPVSLVVAASCGLHLTFEIVASERHFAAPRGAGGRSRGDVGVASRGGVGARVVHGVRLARRRRVGRVGRDDGRGVLSRVAVRAPRRAHAPRPGLARLLRPVPRAFRRRHPPRGALRAGARPSAAFHPRGHGVPRPLARGARRPRHPDRLRVRPERRRPLRPPPLHPPFGRPLAAPRDPSRIHRPNRRDGARDRTVSSHVARPRASPARGPPPGRRRRRVGEPRRGERPRASRRRADGRGRPFPPRTPRPGPPRVAPHRRVADRPLRPRRRHPRAPRPSRLPRRRRQPRLPRRPRRHHRPPRASFRVDVFRDGRPGVPRRPRAPPPATL